MSEMRFVAARVRIDVLQRLDELIDEDVFENRSHAVRVALRELLAKQVAEVEMQGKPQPTIRQMQCKKKRGTRIAEPVVDRTNGSGDISKLLAEVKALQSK